MRKGIRLGAAGLAIAAGLGGATVASAGAASAAGCSVTHTNIWRTSATSTSHTVEVKRSCAPRTYHLVEIKDTWRATGAYSHLYEVKDAWPVGHENVWEYKTAISAKGKRTYTVEHITR
jgi:hypothetical protein